MALPSNYTQKLLMISQELMKIFSRLKGTFTLAKNIRPKRKSKIARNPWTLSCKVPLPSRLTEAKELLKRLTKFESKAWRLISRWRSNLLWRSYSSVTRFNWNNRCHNSMKLKPIRIGKVLRPTSTQHQFLLSSFITTSSPTCSNFRKFSGRANPSCWKPKSTFITTSLSPLIYETSTARMPFFKHYIPSKIFLKLLRFRYAN